MDAAGIGVPAGIELINQAVKARQSIQLSDGKYSFRNLSYGMYRLVVTQPGFSQVSELLEIRSEVPVTRQITLSVQALKSEVVVRDPDTLIDPNCTTAAYFIGSVEIKELSHGQPGRGLIDLIATQPGWLLEANGILHPRQSEYDTQFVVNGFPLQENRSPAFAPTVEADGIESVKVYTSGIPPEFGNKLGGVAEL